MILSLTESDRGDCCEKCGQMREEKVEEIRGERMQDKVLFVMRKRAIREGEKHAEEVERVMGDEIKEIREEENEELREEKVFLVRLLKEFLQ